MVDIAEKIAFASSLIAIFFGLGMQVYRNYQLGKCKDLSFSWMLSSLICNFTWGFYAYVKPDYFLLVVQIPGALLITVVIGQMIHYRKKNLAAEPIPSSLYRQRVNQGLCENCGAVFTQKRPHITDGLCLKCVAATH